MNDRDEAAERFDQLNPDVRRFISRLDDDDVAILAGVMEFWRTLQGFCKVTRWLVLSGIAILLMLSQSWDALKNILGMKGH